MTVVDLIPQVCTKGEGPEAQAVMDRAHLGAMHHYARLALHFARGWDPGRDDKATFFAISYCLGVIGGAAWQVSARAIPLVAKTQWPTLKGLRDRVIKEHRTVTPGLVFGIVQQDLPPLIAALDSLPEARTQ